MRKINLSDFQIAKSETARDINRRIVLNLIRTRQPISRADLARLTGLQRSTVSLIIEQLIEEQWITEGALGHLPRGRKPRFLHLNNERAGIIGVNVRPKLTNIALTDLNANFITQDSLPTHEDPDDFLQELAQRIKKLGDSHPQIYCEGIGVGVPGWVERKNQ
ncbi:MAG TPA: winged helix-turn-helix transcriptional regulator, partial [Pyrinomonadaceae bacterium]|nr:winged helix-turn-helix transcriptional regulator [Pyrinomonadaceae bacterium]